MANFDRSRSIRFSFLLKQLSNTYCFGLCVCVCGLALACLKKANGDSQCERFPTAVAVSTGGDGRDGGSLSLPVAFIKIYENEIRAFGESEGTKERERLQRRQVVVGKKGKYSLSIRVERYKATPISAEFTFWLCIFIPPPPPPSVDRGKFS